MKLHHLAFRTGRLPQLVAFYEQVLGLTRLREQPGYSVWFSLGDAVLMLEQAAAGEPVISAGSRELVALAVDAQGRKALRARLAEVGVPIEQETPHTTYFRDPDGRRLAVSTYPLKNLRDLPPG